MDTPKGMCKHICSTPGTSLLIRHPPTKFLLGFLIFFLFYYYLYFFSGGISGQGCWSGKDLRPYYFFDFPNGFSCISASSSRLFIFIFIAVGFALFSAQIRNGVSLSRAGFLPPLLSLSDGTFFAHKNEIRLSSLH